MAKKKQKRAVKRKVKSKQPQSKSWLIGIIAVVVLIALVAIFINLDLEPGQAVYIGEGIERWGAEDGPINLSNASVGGIIRFTQLDEAQFVDLITVINVEVVGDESREEEERYRVEILPKSPYGYEVVVTNVRGDLIARDILFTGSGEDAIQIYLNEEDQDQDLEVLYQNGEIRVRSLYVLEIESDDDADDDEVPNALDNCPNDVNANQADVDEDDIGDACDTEGTALDCADALDNDADSLIDCADDGCEDACAVLPECGNDVVEDPEECDDGNTVNRDGCSEDCIIEDADGDNILDFEDNCPLVPNENQDDIDDNDIGDVCDPSDDRPPAEEPNCTDSDGGKDIFTRGTILIDTPEEEIIVDDFCINQSLDEEDPSSFLREFFCSADGGPTYDTKIERCPDNSTCRSGACVRNITEAEITVEMATRGANDVGNESALLRGRVLEEAAGDLTIWFEIGDDRTEVEDGDGEVIEVSGEFNGGDDFTAWAKNLTQSKRYYFRACGEDQEEEQHCGEVVSFSTIVIVTSPSEPLICRQNWQCGNWASCYVGVQTRTCSRVDECDEKLDSEEVDEIVSVAKPSERRNCEEEAPVVSSSQICQPNKIRCLGKQLQSCSTDGQSWQTIDTCSGTCDAITLSCKEVSTTSDKKSGGIPGWLFPVLGALALLIGIVVAVVILKQRKELAPAKEYISRARARGISDQQIKSRLVGQGWDVGKVDSLLK